MHHVHVSPHGSWVSRAPGLPQAKWHGATVAVKILRRSDEVGLGDFRTELNVLQKVRSMSARGAFQAGRRKVPIQVNQSLDLPW